MLLKCNIVDGGKLAEAKAKLERAKSNRCDVENYLISWKEAFPTESSWDFIIREKKRQQLQRGRVDEKFHLSYFSPVGHAGSLQETERWIFRICAPGGRAWSPAERDGGGWDFSLRIDFYLHSEFTIRDRSFLLFRRTSSPHTTAWAGWRGSCGRLKTKMAPGGKLPIPGRCEVQQQTIITIHVQPGPNLSGWSALWLWEVRPIRNLDSLWRPGNRKTIWHKRTRKYSCQP